MIKEMPATAPTTVMVSAGPAIMIAGQTTAAASRPAANPGVCSFCSVTVTVFIK